MSIPISKWQNAFLGKINEIIFIWEVELTFWKFYANPYKYFFNTLKPKEEIQKKMRIIF